MRLTATQTVAAPPEDVFDEAADLEGLIADISGRMLQLRRVDAGEPLSAGSRWTGHVDLRGVTGPADLRVADFDPPRGYRVTGTAGGLAADARTHIGAPEPGRAELNLTIELAARSFGGRLVLQSLRLAKPNLERRLNERLAKEAARLERRRNGA